MISISKNWLQDHRNLCLLNHFTKRESFARINPSPLIGQFPRHDFPPPAINERIFLETTTTAKRQHHPFLHSPPFSMKSPHSIPHKSLHITMSTPQSPALSPILIPNLHSNVDSSQPPSPLRHNRTSRGAQMDWSSSLKLRSLSNFAFRSS